jgi:hypothetical protein
VHRDRVYPVTLYAMSRLFISMLMNKSCRVLVAQVLLVKLLCVEQMLEYCGCCGKFVWFITPLEI